MDDDEAGEPEPRLSTVERAKRLSAKSRAEAELLRRRAEAERSRHGSVDALFLIADRDSEVGGGIMAGALAYRLFIWMLPLALVAVALFGVAASAASTDAEHAAHSLSLASIVSRSVASAADSSTRWYALLIGIPILFMTTRSILRALIVCHRIVWSHARVAVPKPTIKSTSLLLAAFVGFFVIAAGAAAARSWSPRSGLLLELVIPIPYAALWLLVSLRLPHRDAPWRALVPGAVLFGVGAALFHFVTAYVLGPQATSKQDTYGALGVAAALLFGLYLLSRLVVFSAVVNATLYDRRSPPA